MIFTMHRHLSYDTLAVLYGVFKECRLSSSACNDSTLKLQLAFEDIVGKAATLPFTHYQLCQKRPVSSVVRLNLQNV